MMLYLFNSAFRPLYVRNVLNTLYLPVGCTNEYRYRHVGEPRYIAPSLYSALPDLKVGTECVVIFIDRFANGGYAYHPLRLADYVLYRDENEYIHFRVRLGQFIYARNLNDFRRTLLQELGPLGIPSLAGGNPESTRDGNYAIQANGIFGHLDDYQRDGEAWNSVVENLSRTTALSSTDKQEPIFLKIHIQEGSKKKRTVTPALVDGAGSYHLTKNKRYELVATYRFPHQRKDQKATAKLNIAFGEGLRALSNPSINVDSHANSVSFPFVSKRYIEDNSGSLSISPVAEEGKPDPLLANSSLQYELDDSVRFWIQIVIALLLFSVIGTLIGTDFSKVEPFTYRALLHAAKQKLLLGVGQTAILFWMFRLIGKKVF